MIEILLTERGRIHGFEELGNIAEVKLDAVGMVEALSSDRTDQPFTKGFCQGHRWAVSTSSLPWHSRFVMAER